MAKNEVFCSYCGTEYDAAKCDCPTCANPEGWTVSQAAILKETCPDLYARWLAARETNNS